MRVQSRSKVSNLGKLSGLWFSASCRENKLLANWDCSSSDQIRMQCTQCQCRGRDNTEFSKFVLCCLLSGGGGGIVNFHNSNKLLSMQHYLLFRRGWYSRQHSQIMWGMLVLVLVSIKHSQLAGGVSCQSTLELNTNTVKLLLLIIFAQTVSLISPGYFQWMILMINDDVCPMLC